MKTVNFFNNDEGVSPIVATLVLIVVAIIGAAAVGLIMGSFSSNVSNQASAGNTANSASTILNVAGSSSMQPTITTLATWYSSNNTGVKVNVVGGGSGAGCIAVGSGLADIGMMSENPTSAQTTKYPNLKTFQVGESGVVFAVKSTTTITTAPTKTELAQAFGYDTTKQTFGNAATYNGNLSVINETVTRSDISGTSDTAFSWMGSTAGTVQPTGSVVSKNGNGDVAKEIYGGDGRIGYLESDYAFGADNSKFSILNVFDGKVYTASSTNIIDEIMYNNDKYPAGLVRPLNLVTNGSPSAIEQAFIQYVQSVGSNKQIQGVFTANHQVHISQVALAFVQ